MEKRKTSTKAILALTLFAAAAFMTGCTSTKRNASSFDNVPARSGGYNSSTVSDGPGNSIQKAYASLYTQQQALMRQADNLAAQMSGATRSKANKLAKELNSVKSELAVVERKMAAYPRSVTDPNYRSEQASQPMSSDLQDKLESLTNAKIAAEDFDNKPIVSDDPELQKAYRLYQQLGDEAFTRQEAAPLTGVVFRVQIATGLPGRKSSFSGINDIYEVEGGKGLSAYYSGAYASYEAAQQACRDIRANTRYKDAFVVAMDGDKRVSLDEARRR